MTVTLPLVYRSFYGLPYECTRLTIAEHEGEGCEESNKIAEKIDRKGHKKRGIDAVKTEDWNRLGIHKFFMMGRVV